MKQKTIVAATFLALGIAVSGAFAQGMGALKGGSDYEKRLEQSGMSGMSGMSGNRSSTAAPSKEAAKKEDKAKGEEKKKDAKKSDKKAEPAK